MGRDFPRARRLAEENLEHLLRAAADVTGMADLLVLGSQAILGTHPDREIPQLPSSPSRRT